MIEAVLDASALLALLHDEPGADKVQPVLANSAMTTVNLAEVVGHYARFGTEPAAIRRALTDIKVSYIPPDEALAHDIGMLQPITAAAGLSLGDRACLALGRRLEVRVLTADRTWLRFAAAAGVTIELIR